jgi:hypothetical protein
VARTRNGADAISRELFSGGEELTRAFQAAFGSQMKLCNAAPLALVGWYLLMLPPERVASGLNRRSDVAVR